MNTLMTFAMRPLMGLTLAAALAVPGLARADADVDGGPASVKASAVKCTVVGFWLRTTKDNDGQTPFLSLKKDGRVVSGVVTAVGGVEVCGDFPYRVEDGVLSINGDEKELVADLQWLDANHFRLTIAGQKPTTWVRVEDSSAAKPAPKINKPAVDAIDLTDTGWLRVDATSDGIHKTLYFAPGGVLVVAEVNEKGQIMNKTLGRYTQDGNKVVLRDANGEPVVYWTMTRDTKGYIHMTRGDGEETVWMPLSK